MVLRLGAAARYPGRSALARLEAGIFFVDHVNPAFAAHDTAAFFTQFGGFQRISDFHRTCSHFGFRPRTGQEARKLGEGRPVVNALKVKKKVFSLRWQISLPFLPFSYAGGAFLKRFPRRKLQISMNSVSANVATADNLKGMIWMATYAVFMSGMHVCVRLVSEGLHPFEIAFFRNVFALIVLVPWFWRLGLAPLKTKRFGLLFTRGALNTFCMLAFFTALSIGHLAEIAALSFTAPIYATLIGMVVFHERVGLKRWSAILIGFAGVIVILRPGFHEIGFSQMLVLSSAFGWAICMVMVKELGRTESAITITAYMSLVMAPLSLVPALFYWQWPSWTQLGWLVFLGALGGAGQLAMTQSLRLAETHVVTPFDFLRLVFVSILGYLVFDQVVDIYVWLGGTMIFAAVAFIAYREHARRRAEGVSAAPSTGDA